MLESLLLLIGVLIVFALGPLLGFLDVLTRELLLSGARSGYGFGKALVVLFVPLAWIVYFFVYRRRRPFAEDGD